MIDRRYYLSEMGPHTRRAMHQALDLVLDALERDAREEPVKRTRRRPTPAAELPANVSGATVKAANDALERAGLPHLRGG